MSVKPADPAAAPRKTVPSPEKGPVRGASGKKRLALALQGGGAHGAFTWGVLDRFLEDGRLEIEAITGTSAGAMNAVAFAQGLIEGGAEGARLKLERFWRAVSDDAALSPVQRTLWDRLLGSWSLDNSPGYLWFDASRAMPALMSSTRSTSTRCGTCSPRRSTSRSCAPIIISIFIAATNVTNGKVKVFPRKELDVDKVLASACPPFPFQAVEIEGAPYWDGGYMGNPVLWPLFYSVRTNDILIVQINPIERRDTPRTAMEIQNRLNEITFNAALMGELRMIEFVTRQIDKGRLSAERYKRLNMHRISGGAALDALSASTKLNAEWDFLTYMRDLGREAAHHWLDAHYADIGERSTLDLRGMLS